MKTKLNPTLRAELAKLDTEQVLELLGEIVQPSIYTRFADLPEDFADALLPIEQAYSAAYDGLKSIATGENADPEAAFWAEADYRYEQRRDEIDEADLPY